MTVSTLTDYQGPVQSVRIIRPTVGAEEPNRILDLRNWFRRRKPTDFPNVTAVTVQYGMGFQNYSVNIEMTVGYDDYIALQTEYTDAFIVGAIVEVKLGYANGFFTRTFLGYVQNATVNLQGLVGTIALEASSGAWSSGTIEGIQSQEGRRVIDVIQEIAETRGFGLSYLDSLGDRAELGSVPPTALSNLNKVVDQVVEGTDLYILNYMIRVVAGYELYDVGNQITIVNLLEQTLEQRIPIFVYAGKLAVEVEQYPVVTFNSQNSQLAYKAETRNVRASDVKTSDKSEGNVSEKDTSSEDLNIGFVRSHGIDDRVDTSLDILGSLGGLVSSAVEAVGSALGRRRTGVVKTPYRQDNAGRNLRLPVEDPLREEKLALLKRSGELVGGLQAELATVGYPGFEPGQNVGVLGVGPLFEGRWYISAIRHEGNLNGYVTTLSLITTGKYNEDTPLLQRTSGPLSREALPKPKQDGEPTKTPKPGAT